MLRMLEQHSFVKDFEMLVSFARECRQRPEFRPNEDVLQRQGDDETPTIRGLMELAKRREAKRSGSDKSDSYFWFVRALVNFKEVQSRVSEYIPFLARLAGMSEAPEAAADSVSAVLRLVSG